MALSEIMLDSIIPSLIHRVTGKMEPSKKNLRMRIEDLEKEVSRIAEENKISSEAQSIMVLNIIDRLKELYEHRIQIDVDTIIIFTDANNGDIKIENKKEATPLIDKGKNIVSTDGINEGDESFFVTDEDLARIRMQKKYMR